MDATTAARLADAWVTVTGEALTADEVLELMPEDVLSGLGRFSWEILVSAGYRVRSRPDGPSQGRRWRLPARDWLAACVALVQARADLDREGPPFYGVDRSSRGGRLLAARREHRRFVERFIPARPDHVYRKKLAVGEVPGLEAGPADEAEVEAALILARTAPDGQFSSTGTGEVFVGFHHGYHREPDREYVTGLSSELDRIGRVVDDHRGPGAWPPGGRFYVLTQPPSYGHAMCAACHRVIAIIGRPAPPSHCTGKPLRGPSS